MKLLFLTLTMTAKAGCESRWKKTSAEVYTKVPEECEWEARNDFPLPRRRWF